MKNALTKLIANIADLIKVKSIITLCLIAATVYLAIRNGVAISPEAFMAIITAVMTYYFTKKDGDGKS